VLNERSGLFFFDAPGGTGKTFLISLLLAYIHSLSEIVLALASSGMRLYYWMVEGQRILRSKQKLCIPKFYLPKYSKTIQKSSFFNDRNFLTNSTVRSGGKWICLGLRSHYHPRQRCFLKSEQNAAIRIFDNQHKVCSLKLIGESLN